MDDDQMFGKKECNNPETSSITTQSTATNNFATGQKDSSMKGGSSLKKKKKAFKGKKLKLDHIPVIFKPITSEIN